MKLNLAWEARIPERTECRQDISHVSSEGWREHWAFVVACMCPYRDREACRTQMHMRNGLFIVAV